MATLEVSLQSATGRRAENQDRVSQFESPFGRVFIVADGMGGHQGGGVASTLATAACKDLMQSMPISSAPDEALKAAIKSANRSILQESRNGDQSLPRMGSTIVSLLVSETPRGLLAIGAHVGDSRLYFARDKRLFRLTEDHTVVRELVRNNTLTEQQANDHPQAGVLSRALGQKEDLQVDLTAWMLLQPGDIFMLCSDGLSGYVDDQSLLGILSSGDNMNALAASLVDSAFANGSDDNVSAMLIRVESAEVS